MHDAYRILRQKQMRATPQRLSVYEAFHGKGQHLSAEEIYQKTHQKIPGISLGTVYKILNDFKKKGLLTEIKIDFEKSLYERKEAAHHHFLCRCCGMIFDVMMPACRALNNGLVEGHSIEEFQGYFYGTCRDCKKG